jgi:hypothetical protein
MFPPLALVAGWLLIRLDAQTVFRLVLPLVVAGGVVLAGLLVAYDTHVPRFASAMLPVSTLLGFGAWLKGAAAVEVAGGIAALVAFRLAARMDTARFWGIALLSVSSLAGLQLAVAGFDAFSTMRSTSTILRSAQATSPFAGDAPFYQVEMYDQTIPFYLGRTTRLVAFRDELSLGIDAEPAKQIATTAAWLDEWRRLDRGYAVMPPDAHARLTTQGGPMRELARDPRRIVVSRR